MSWQTLRIEAVAYLRDGWNLFLTAIDCLLAQILGSWRGYKPSEVCGDCWKCATMRYMMVISIVYGLALWMPAALFLSCSLAVSLYIATRKASPP